MKIEKGQIYQDKENKTVYKILSAHRLKSVIKVQKIAESNFVGHIDWVSRLRIKRKWNKIPELKAKLLYEN